MAKTIPVKVDNPCERCTGSWCCTYFTQQIDTPKSREDFDVLLWQVSHEHTEAYKDEDGWFLLMTMPCTHLKPNGNCGIYETRPKICRDHTSDSCEIDGLAGEEDFDLYFKNYDALRKYCRKRFKKWDKWEKSKKE
jgi:Fe-S-cluster containining protein